LHKKGISFSATPSLVKHISEQAIKEKMGARPIKRILQKSIENELSRLILSKTLQDGSLIKFKYLRGNIEYDIKEEEA
jgi:ATP-dependent Clp protease ATP-binding subunit ClpA